MTAIAIQHKAEILDMLRQGYVLREIAPKFGICKQAISRALKDDPEYHEAQIDQAEAMVEEAKQETFAARDPVDIARAREIARFAFRYAEAVNPARWSPKREVLNINVDSGSWSDRLRRARERSIGSGTAHNGSGDAIEHKPGTHTIDAVAQPVADSAGPIPAKDKTKSRARAHIHSAAPEPALADDSGGEI